MSDTTARMYMTLDATEEFDIDELGVTTEELREMEDQEVYNIFKTRLNEKISDMDDEEELEYYRKMRLDMFAVTLESEDETTDAEEDDEEETEEIIFERV